MNRDAIFLEHLEHADVRGAARATAREHQTDARARLYRTNGRTGGCNWLLGSQRARESH
jgi:hypothetical protein